MHKAAAWRYTDPLRLHLPVRGVASTEWVARQGFSDHVYIRRNHGRIWMRYDAKPPRRGALMARSHIPL